MNNVKHKLLIMSGKGGVGKTMVAVNLSYTLSEMGFKVGLLDVDIHGPNAPKMFGIEDEKPLTNGKKMIPVQVKNNLKVMSMAFFLDHGKAAIWRGPLKHNVIKQFIEDVDWGKLDYLVIDFPPGTGDEAISASQIVKGITGSVIVSTPQQVALLDVAKSVDFLRSVSIPIIGIIENMSGDVFGEGGVKSFADNQNISFLGSLKLDKKIMESGDMGKPFVNDKTLSVTKSLNSIVEKVINFCKNKKLNGNALSRPN